jgi:hypothetical protein
VADDHQPPGTEKRSRPGKRNDFFKGCFLPVRQIQVELGRFPGQQAPGQLAAGLRPQVVLFAAK